jgi:hypothetical protein
MRFRALQSIPLAISIAVLSLAASRVVGQAPSAKTTAVVTGSRLRTPWGHPDLQGTWRYSQGTTPLERPSQFAGRPFLTDDELAQAEQQIGQRNSRDRRDGSGTDADVARDYNEFWDEGGKTKTIRNRRTSLITDSDGKLPPLTPEGRQRQGARAEAARQRGAADSWEDRTLQERCMTFRDFGPPLFPVGGGDKLLGRDRLIQILQTPQYVAMVHEYIQGPRIIPLDGRPHLSPNVRQWQGDSRGHWEGRSLVVETTNFVDEGAFSAAEADLYHRLLKDSYEHLHLIERFTRVDAVTINYEFTFDAPTTFVRPWTAAFPLRLNHGAMFETSCHEGNYGLMDILRGARTQEGQQKASADAAKKGSR